MANQPFTGAGTGAPDWSLIPAPEDDGAADHLTEMALPDVALPATDGSEITLSKIEGRTVVYIYPMTGQPNPARGEVAITLDGRARKMRLSRVIVSSFSTPSASSESSSRTSSR